MGLFCSKYHFFASSFASFLSASPRSLCFPLPQKLPQQEGEKIREGVELAVKANVAVAQLDTVANIRIAVALNEFHERLGAAILRFHLHRDERASIPNEEVHLYRALLIAVIIQLIAGVHQHVADNILVDGTLVSTEVAVSSEILLRLLIKRGDKQTSVFEVNLVLCGIVVTL